jgi:hypothetical protein
VEAIGLETGGFRPTRLEVLASAGATALLTLSAVTQVDPNISTLRSAYARLGSEPWWVKIILGVPVWGWIVAVVLVGAALFWLGLKTARRWGAPMLFVAPVVMLVLQFGVPWLLLAPIRAATAGTTPKF